MSQYEYVEYIHLTEKPASSQKMNTAFLHIYKAITEINKQHFGKNPPENPDEKSVWLDANYTPARLRVWDDEQTWKWQGLLFGTSEQKPLPENTVPGTFYLSYDTEEFEFLSLKGEENADGEIEYTPAWLKLAACTIAVDSSGIVDVDSTNVQSALEQLSVLLRTHEDRVDNPHEVTAGQIPSSTTGLDGETVASELESASRELNKRIKKGGSYGQVPVSDGAGGIVYSAPLDIPVMDVNLAAKRAALKYGG